MIKRKSSSHVVAVCWDARRFHFLVTDIKGDSVDIRESVSLFWEDGYAAVELAECIKMTLSELGIRKPNVVIGIARSQADLFNFDIPPATELEVPGLVRTGVARQHGEILADELVDYTVLDSSKSPIESVRSIEAGVLRRETKRDIDQLCEALGERPKSIVLRTFSVASLFRRLVGSQNNCLVVNRLDEAADLLVFDQGQVVFNRSVRFEAEQTALADRAISLSEEISRTIASAPHELERSAPTYRIFMFGLPDRDDDFVTALEQELSLSVTLVNPFGDTEGGEIRTVDTCPSAALIGMVRDFSEDAAKIDFANPKKSPKPPNRIRQAVFYTVAAAATIAILGWSSTEKVRSLSEANDKLQAEIDSSMAEYRMLRKRTLVVDEIAQWRRDEVNWLDELRDLSRRLPNSSDAVVDRINLGGNRVTMSVRGRDPSIVHQFESAVRDHPFRSVSSGRISQPNEETAFPCQFEATLTLTPRRPKQEYLKPLANHNEVETTVTEVARDER